MQNDVSFAPRRKTMSPITGGIVALTYPTVLVIISLSTGFRQGGDMADFAATLAGTLLFLVAAPTAWVLSFDFIDVTRFTVLVFGIVTSAPLWWILGVSIARRSESVVEWSKAYAFACVGWTAANLILFGVIAGLSS
ncbi:MAG: hypothetical protein ACR2N2_03255 [Acidimicrobiia bacterium]